MGFFKDYLAYIKDNPEGYWFKRKTYGWGWTPATREGWLVTVGFMGLIVGIAWRAEYAVTSSFEVWTEVLLPVFIVVVVLVGVCWRTGEPPQWQWGIPKKKTKE